MPVMAQGGTSHELTAGVLQGLYEEDLRGVDTSCDESTPVWYTSAVVDVEPSCLGKIDVPNQPHSPIISVTRASARSERILFDDPLQVRVTDLSPLTLVGVMSCLEDEKSNLFYSCAYYRSDDNGVVDMDRDEAVDVCALLTTPISSSSAGEGRMSIPRPTYTGCHPMGWVWSMRPIPGCRFGLRFVHRDVTIPSTVHLTVLTFSSDSPSNPSTTASSSSIRAAPRHTRARVVSSVTVRRWYLAENVRRVPLTFEETGMVGTLFLPETSGTKRVPTVVDLFGSTGGLVEFRAALMASRAGVACLALAYVTYGPHLPKNLYQLNLDYFDNALKWLVRQPFCSPRIGMCGVSYGAELSLLLASLYPNVIGAVVALSCSHVNTNMELTYRGKRVPCVTLDFSRVLTISMTTPGLDFDKNVVSVVGEDNSVITISGGVIRRSGGDDKGTTDATGAVRSYRKIDASEDRDVFVWDSRAMFDLWKQPSLWEDVLAGRHGDKVVDTVKAACIEVEKMRAHVLFISGVDDKNWPAPAFSEMAMERLRACAFKYSYEHVSYQGAGHLVEPPFAPTCQHSWHPFGGVMLWGGRPYETNQCQERSWPRILEFLQKHLPPRSCKL
eukprot:TRINITY_DN4462_c0_g1_i2.p1 TRINITY_DN4462_c0_g1~~TRINITY_DN4462_c0_g1_i2.p1  ORF type:complete len:613 (+),score=73.74 TRINITY_DN4462_c0_g1_i2:241-2079(+)